MSCEHLLISPQILDLLHASHSTLCKHTLCVLKLVSLESAAVVTVCGSLLMIGPLVCGTPDSNDVPACASRLCHPSAVTTHLLYTHHLLSYSLKKDNNFMSVFFQITPINRKSMSSQKLKEKHWIASVTVVPKKERTITFGFCCLLLLQQYSSVLAVDYSSPQCQCWRTKTTPAWTSTR